MFCCSGRLIRTLANMKYGNYKMTPVEITYNIISFIIPIVLTIAFTVYAKRALNNIKMSEDIICKEGSSIPIGSGALKNHHPQGRAGSHSIELVIVTPLHGRVDMTA
jgi:hypothetical protein